VFGPFDEQQIEISAEDRGYRSPRYRGQLERGGGVFEGGAKGL
jgi:hypothetical protein